MEPGRDFLRHTLATVAYRADKILRDAPDAFAALSVGHSVRTPPEILAHIGDLFDWALSSAAGHERWHESSPLPWREECERFFTALRKFDDYLASSEALHIDAKKLFQGPVADALTHLGQMAMLRRVAGSPIRGENFVVAEIAVGRVGPLQRHSGGEFD